MLDRFLFAQAMENPVVSQSILQIILNEEIHLLDKNETEKEFRTSPIARSIRIDVYSMDDRNSIYDTEVQKTNTGNLPKRSRFYQALLDSSLLAPGTRNFNRMKDCCLIIISPFDLWSKGRYRYTFHYRCDEDNSLALGDGATRIFLNTHGTDASGVSEELIELLHYLEYSSGSDPYPVKSPRIQEIARQVERIRFSEELRGKYMHMHEWVDRLIDTEDAEERGRMIHLVSLVRKKSRKGLSLEEISEEVEEDVEVIQPFYTVIQAHPELSAEEVYYSLYPMEDF